MTHTCMSGLTPPTEDALRSTIGKEYPLHKNFSSNSIFQNIYVFTHRKQILGESEIVFIVQENESSSVFEIKTLKTKSRTLDLLAGRYTHAGYLENLMSDVYSNMQTAVTRGIFACIILDILSAQFRYKDTSRGETPENKPCIVIRNPTLWTPKKFPAMAKTLTNLVFGYATRTDTKISETDHCIQVSRTIRIIWKNTPNFIIGLNASDAQIPIKNVSIVPCDSGTALTFDSFLLFHVQWTAKTVKHTEGNKKPREGHIVAMYVGSNMLPMLYFGLNPWRDNDDDDRKGTTHSNDIYCCPIQQIGFTEPSDKKIKFGKRIEELVLYTTEKLKDKTKLHHIIAGLVCAKATFNAGSMHHIGADIYCSPDLLDNDSYTDALVTWTKFITAQKNLSDINVPAPQEENPELVPADENTGSETYSEDWENASNADTDDSDEKHFRATVSYVNTNTIICMGEQMERKIEWMFSNDIYKGEVVTVKEICDREDEPYTLEPEHEIENSWDMESRFNTEKTMSRMILYLNMHGLEC